MVAITIYYEQSPLRRFLRTHIWLKNNGQLFIAMQIKNLAAIAC